MELRLQDLLNQKRIVTSFKKYSKTSLFILFFSCSESHNSPNISSPSIENSDPLYTQQWHLHNTGQFAFSDSGGNIGVDLNLQGVSQTGEGIVVNVIDCRLELDHEDLDGNIIVNRVKVFPSNEADCRPKAGHGTAVAGIIAAETNEVGGRGVAPSVSLISHNFLEVQGKGNEITSLNASADIANQSYGTLKRNDIRIGSGLEQAIKDRVENGRSEKGTIFVKAAGNGFGDLECLTLKTDLPPLTAGRITCQNASMDPTNTLPYNIVVAAVNANGEKSSYSTAGSAIFVSGFGGESGVDFPAIITTDKQGCNQGFSINTGTKVTRISPALDPNCNYTNFFNGTSSAVPMVSGVIALMLEANSSLTWRDVRYILVHSARKIDEDREVVKTSTKEDRVIGDATAELGWTKNAAGLEFHNWYGFGLVDASRAVRMAKGYTSSLGNSFIKVVAPLSTDQQVNQPIPNKDVNGVSDILHIDDNIIVETVRVDIKITHSYSADIGIFLVSPSGTTSLLFNFGNFFGDSDDLDFVLSTEAFYGESTRGEWKIKVIDYLQEDKGDFDNWRLEIYGAEQP